MISPIRQIDYNIVGNTGTVTPDFDPFINLIKLETTGTVTLTANFSLNLVNYQVSPIYIPILFDGTVILDGFSFNLAGISIKQSKLKGKTLFMLFYDGTAWTLLAESDDNSLPDVIAGEKVITVPTSGTVTLVPGIDENYVRVTGTQTLTGNYTIAFANGVENDWFYIDVKAFVTTNANVLNIGTIVIEPATALASNYTVFAYCAGGANWRAQIIDGNISTSKLQSIAARSVLGNATASSASPTAITFANDGDLLMRDGTTMASKKLEEKNFGTGLAVVKQENIQISSSQILNGFTSPIEILDAAGSGKTNILLSVIADCAFGTAAYATNTNVRIYQTGSSSSIGVQNGLIGFTANQLAVIPVPQVSGSLSEQYIKNAKTFLQVLTGNPTAGDGTITLTVTYITIQQVLP
jgi:hypothetical protein